MSTFTKNSVTLKGAVAIAALMAGGTLEFTRIAVGDGNIPEGQTALTMTDLSHHLFDVDINEVYSDSESQATVIGIFNNSQTETGFYYRELGLFAKDPATGSEILFCYGNAGDEAEWISPAGSESVIEKEVHIVTLVGNATEVKATLKSGIYLTQEQAKLKADLDATEAEGGRVVPEQMRFDEIQDIYVDAAATAEGADGSEAKPFKTFATALNAFYPGARVVRINVKAGTYDETVSVQNAPGTLFHFSRNGDGIVTIKTLSAIFTQIYMSDMTITGQTTEGNAVTLSNVGNFALQRVTVGGTNNTSGVACYNSKGFLESVTINGCGTAFEARDGSQVALRGCTGAGNVVGVAAFESVVTLAEHTMTATTPYVTSNGGAINDSYGTSTFPSNFHPGYYLGNFTTMDALRQALLAEFQKLQSGSSRFVSFAGNIAGGIGEFAEGQMMNATITKTSESGSGYGYVIFHAHNGPIFGYMQIGEGAFKTQTPISLAKWQIINDTSANIGDLTTGIYTIQSGSNGTAGVPSAQNGTLIVDKNVGVPYQIYITDYENIMYKRIFADGAWQAWARFPGIATTEEYGLIRLASESDVLKETDNKVMDVPLAYEINDFRRMNKTYAVGDKVNCAFRFEWFLECTKAGTTSNETLDTRNVTFGQTITDGTCQWTVRSHVRSVNGVTADKDGNIVNFETYGKWGLGSYAESLVTLFPSNDANDIDKTGFYTIAGASNVSPSSNTCTLLHIQRKFPAGNTAFQMQFLNEGRIAVRSQTNDETWCDWYELAQKESFNQFKSGEIYIRNKNLTKGETPEATTWTRLFITDKNNSILGSIGHRYGNDGSARIHIAAYNPKDNSQSCNIGVGYDSNGNVLTYAPTPPTRDNSTKIATTAWVNKAFLPLTGGTVTGFISATGFKSTSDVRLKSDIKPIDSALIKIDSISGNTYTLEGCPVRQAGVIAQDVEKVLPEAVVTGKDGFKAVDYNAVVALLVNAIKELKAEIEVLKNGK